MWYSEENLIDRVARFTPWLAPAIPAAFAYQSATNSALLNQHWLMGLLIALTIEGLGLAAVHTSLSLFEYGKTHDKQKPKAETAIMLLMTLFYLAIVVVVNIVLDLRHEWQIIVAKALLSLVSIPAAVTLSIRQLHKARLHDEDEHKAELTARGKLGALTKKYNELDFALRELKQTNAELKKANSSLLADLEQAKKQPTVKQESATAVNQPAPKRKSKKKANAEILICEDCGKECNGIKGLNGHRAWCKGKPVAELVKANGHLKEKSY